MKISALIEDTGSLILSQDHGAVVRFRLLRDVLKKPESSAEMRQARIDLWQDPCVKELESEQQPDGSWGAFHSRNSRLRQVIPTTEVGVERAAALGLDLSHPLVKLARIYLRGLLEGKTAFPDRAEKNDLWKVATRLFPASTLAQIAPLDPILNPDRELWRDIVIYIFRSGRYSAEDESVIHDRLTGATVRDSWLALGNRYQLALLSSLPELLPASLEQALLAWIWRKPTGLGYLTVPVGIPPQPKKGIVDRWLGSHEMLARFAGWAAFAAPMMEWLVNQRNEQGWWDFGGKPDSIARMPFTHSWRERKNRSFDWSTRVLALLRRYDDYLGCR